MLTPAKLTNEQTQSQQASTSTWPSRDRYGCPCRLRLPDTAWHVSYAYGDHVAEHGWARELRLRGLACRTRLQLPSCGVCAAN